jgi:hypothetical protein
MKLVYTSTFSLGTNPVLIQKGATPGGGTIPNKYNIGYVIVEPANSTDALSVKGTDEDSDWIPQPAGGKVYADRLSDGDRLVFYIKSASGTINVNLYAEGA